MFSSERFAAAPHQIDQIMALSGVRSGTVLDLCCGPGIHTLELARRGFQVTGVDGTQYLLDRAQAAAAGATVKFVHQDMREFSRPSAFDLIVNMFTSFGYFEDPADELRVLTNIYASLRPGGVFLIDLLGKECLAARNVAPRCVDFDDGATVLQRAKVLDDWTRVFSEWTVIKGGAARTYSFNHTIYSGRELKDLLLRAGFTNIRLYGALSGQPYGPDSQRLIAVACK
jgi:SAM-dependent methyltransferase